MVGKPLTEAEKETILKWYRNKELTCPELIGQALGKHHQTIRFFLRSQGIRLPRYKPNLRRPTVKTLDKVKASYLAGIIDGEGSFGLNKGGGSWMSTRVQLVVGSKDKRLIDWLLQNVGGRSYIRRNSGLKRGILHIWMLTKVLDVLKVLKMIHPYLVIKKEKAEEVIAFCEKRMADLYGSRSFDLLLTQQQV
jgi:hypothetical protein